MKNYLVQDLMVPLSEYATVSATSTILDAMLTLEKAQRAFDHTKYTHRSVLVFDRHNKIVGKLAFIDLLSALGSHRQILEKQQELFKFGFSNRLTHQIYLQRHLTADSLRNLCEKTGKLKVEDFMQIPTPGEYVEHDLPLKAAIYQLVSGNHLSLLVTREENIVGILRLTDVFAAVFHTMKRCEIRS